MNTPGTPRRSELDHLVLLAATLEQGLDWCEARLGIRPATGGEHPLMGTHNRVLRIDSDAFPKAYFEIIAINPAQPSQRAPGTRRWFDLDSPGLQATLASRGPQLGHFVARVDDAQHMADVLAGLGLDCGPVLELSRDTPQGLLQWRIAVRDDGQRLLDGALPSLLQWGLLHPVAALPASGIRLQSVHVSHMQSDLLDAAYRLIGLEQLALQPGPFGIRAQLSTAAGTVTI